MLTVTELDDTNIEAAGALMAAEQTAARRTLPSLPAAFTNPDVCTSALSRLQRTGYAGVLATERGSALGVMMLGVMTGVVYGQHGRIPADGFAVLPDLADPTTVLARLFGEVSPSIVATGVRYYFLEHLACPPVSVAAANLAFGRHHVYASQPAAPRPGSDEVTVRLGRESDLQIIAQLAELELQHRATPPIYVPPPPHSVADLVDQHRHLQEHGATHLIASVGGRDVGLLTIELTSPAPRVCPDGQPYIGPTVTHPDARGRGVGTALVNTALTWASTHGHHWLSVDFEPANPLSRPFWLGSGFEPTAYAVLRSILPAA
jgi:GNAT superfamily N-acetyltransferase